jgi:hypothetical protein
MANDPKNRDSVFLPYIIDHPVFIIADEKGILVPLKHITGTAIALVFSFAL